MSKCKYYLEKEVVSYDGGITWNETGVTRRGNLYEESSEDCTDPSVQYRWINMDVTTDYICDGTNKYYKQKKQVSYDGIIWQDVTPAEYQRGSIYEVNSPDCQPTKFQATYGGQTYEKKCDGNATLATGDTKPEGYEYSAMTSAVIGDCVTSIDNAAFRNCSGLTSVTIPNSVTSIGYWAFYFCTSLTSIVIPSGVTSIGNLTFFGCSGLTSITIPDSVTSIGGDAFDYCYGLTSIDIPSGVTSIAGNAFSWCRNITNINVNNNNTVYDSRNNCNAIIETNTNKLITGCKNTIIPDSVTSIGMYAFGGCSGLTSIVIPSGVTSIGTRAFESCTSLTSIDIPSGVTSISESAFIDCISLTSVTIPNSVTSIGYWAFWDCSSLTSITIPNSVTSIGNGAFYFCRGLTGVTVNATTPPTLGTDAFYNTNNCPIYVPASSVETYKSAWSDYSSRIQAIP